MTTQPTQPTPKAKSRWPFFGLALITIGLSSWGLFRLFVDFAGMPVWLAPFAVGGLDLVAVGLGSFAVTVSGDGDSPWPWSAALLVFTGLAAGAQYWHALLANQPQIIGITMAAFPVATVLLFEGQLRRAARLHGRKLGLVPPPRASLPLKVWVHFPADAWRTTRAAIRAQGHLGDAKPEPEQVTLNRGAVAVATLQRPERAIEPAPALGAPVRSGHDRPQSVAASVRAAADRLGSRDIDAVLAEVKRTTHPDVSRDTVRKNLSRLESNGHVHA